jgi:lactoylglutathione lyase
MSTKALQAGHVGLNVTDLNRSAQFYRDIFDFNVIGESHEPGREYSFLGRGDQLFLTLWKQSEGSFQRDLPGLHHLSFQVDSVAEVRQVEGRLRKRNAKIYHDGIASHGEGQSSGGIYFEDPDGIRLEVFAPEGVDKVAAPTLGAPTCGFF